MALGWLVGDTSSPATVQHLTMPVTKDRFPEWAEQDYAKWEMDSRAVPGSVLTREASAR